MGRGMLKVPLALCVILIILFSSISVVATQAHHGAKFEPPDGKALLIIGQDLGAIGGLPGYGQGYVDGLGIVPAGLTTYANVTSATGLTSMADWGSGDTYAQLLVENPRFKNCILVIGLYVVGNEEIVAIGKHDTKLRELGLWIKSQNRPVFLRIGYEFDGPWNHYDPESYIASFRRIVEIFRKLGITNCTTVWQSSGNGEPNYLMQWYPGDEYVDWCGYSHFQSDGQGIIEIARAHNKPVMIAEATPADHRLDLEDGHAAWDGWFAPLFRHARANADVIKALAYINTDWHNQPMWRTGYFGQTDSRVQINPYLRARWLEEINSGFWLNSSPSLFQTIGYQPTK